MVLAPSTIQEAVDLMSSAFDKADRYRIPVLLLVDGLLAQMMEPVALPEAASEEGRPPKPWATVGWDDKIRPQAVVTSEYLVPAELEEHNRALQRKYAEITANEIRLECNVPDEADLLVVAYGSTARIARTAVDMLNAQGQRIGLARPISLWPFPSQALAEAALKARSVLVLEAANIVMSSENPGCKV